MIESSVFYQLCEIQFFILQLLLFKTSLQLASGPVGLHLVCVRQVYVSVGELKVPNKVSGVELAGHGHVTDLATSLKTANE